jgi:glycosyltransferase involved in cell wall biosynthesis
MKYSIVIATYNRAADLRDTLASLAGIQADGPWEVVVVDNNSSDDTRQIVERAALSFPVELRYLFEGRQGRSPALNTGIAAARGEIIVTTDDDVRVPAGWLNAAGRGLQAADADYVGGRVLPIWSAPRPAWLPERGGRLWAVVALLDYGDAPREFGARVPLGVNMAFRRSALERAGLLDPSTGRKAGTLLGQEIREWCIRARRVGVRGFYVPDMVVEHLIPADRLTKTYFRRWFYWRGISRALLYQRAGLDLENPEESTIDVSKVAHIAGVPRYMFRRAIVAARDWLVAMLRRRTAEAFEHETWLWFFAGVVRQRWRDSGIRRATHGELPESALHAAASRDRVA